MKVSELENALLDYWAAKARGWRYAHIRDGVCFAWPTSNRHSAVAFKPSTNWAQGGPIIEREGIELKRSIRHLNIARIGGFEPDLTMPGKTPLIAAMRCFVASKYGDTCPDPE